MSYRTDIIRWIAKIYGKNWRKSQGAQQALRNINMAESKTPYSTIVQDSRVAKLVLKKVRAKDTKAVGQISRWFDTTPGKLINDSRKMLMRGTKSNPLGSKRNMGSPGENYFEPFDDIMTANLKGFHKRK